MRRLDLTLPTPEENLALDEALLLRLEADLIGETLRLWESPVRCVVLGASGRLVEEVDEEACRASGVPVLRRASGGGAVLLGPGCLNFTLCLSLGRRPHLRDVPASYRDILERTVSGLAVPGARFEPPSDLAHDGSLKFSGNAQRRLQRAMIHHGTILHDADVGSMARLLREPRRRPAWRGERTHREFVGSLPLSVEEIRERIMRAWGAWEETGLDDYPEIEGLLARRYANPTWTRRL